jgi:predicted nucleotidyltransferase
MEGETLSSVLMRTERLRVVNTLMKNREDDFTIRGLSEESGTDYKVTHGLVHKLEEFGIVDIADRGNSKFVGLNRDSPYIDVLDKLGNIDSDPLKKIAHEFAEEVSSRHGKIDSVFLYGSVLKGLPSAESDIDILVLVSGEDQELESIRRDIFSLRDRYEREEKVDLSVLIMEEKEFISSVKNESPLETKIKEEGRLLEGEEPAW